MFDKIDDHFPLINKVVEEVLNIEDKNREDKEKI